jgi:hypothetical protein
VAILLSVVGAIAATLIGLLVGGQLTSRTQTQQWFRDRQIEACTDILKESTVILLQYGRSSREHEKAQIDWVPWNSYLALISIVAEQSIVDAAIRIDTSFWEASPVIKSLNASDEDWFRIRDEIESCRLAFINTARTVLGRSGGPLMQILGRPSEWPAEPPKDDNATNQVP